MGTRLGPSYPASGTRKRQPHRNNLLNDLKDYDESIDDSLDDSLSMQQELNFLDSKNQRLGPLSRNYSQEKKFMQGKNNSKSISSARLEKIAKKTIGFTTSRTPHVRTNLGTISRSGGLLGDDDMEGEDEVDGEIGLTRNQFTFLQKIEN